MRSLKIDWNQFIHAGLTPAQQIIMFDASPTSQGPVVPSTYFRLTEDGNFRATEAGDRRITQAG